MEFNLFYSSMCPEKMCLHLMIVYLSVHVHDYINLFIYLYISIYQSICISICCCVWVFTNDSMHGSYVKPFSEKRRGCVIYIPLKRDCTHHLKWLHGIKFGRYFRFPVLLIPFFFSAPWTDQLKIMNFLMENRDNSTFFDGKQR